MSPQLAKPEESHPLHAVTFAGAAPGMVDGVNQLNILLSANTPTGNALPLVITVGGQPGTAAATLSVR